MQRNNSISDFQYLVNIIKTLRGPDGCPWDKKQTPEDVKTYLLEEVYELIEAIDENKFYNIKEELGDLLLLIIFLSDYYKKENKFDLSEVIENISSKLVNRHPHVFGDKKFETSDEVIKNWDKLKKEEKKRKSFLEGIPKSAPALLRVYLFLKKAYRFNKAEITGHEENIRNINSGLDKIRDNNIDKEKNIGKLLFEIVKLATNLKIEPESALLRYLENCYNDIISDGK